MQTRTIGNSTVGTVEVGAIGLGEMPMPLAGPPGGAEHPRRRDRALPTSPPGGAGGSAAAADLRLTDEEVGGLDVTG